MQTNHKVALITGASKGLGLALAEALAQRKWYLIINARNAEELLHAKRHLEQWTSVTAISGDVRDEVHLIQFREVLQKLNTPLDLVVNNASTLGASPQPQLLDYPIETIHSIVHTNLIAPLSLLQKVRPFLADHPTVINISSDAAVEPYPGWGGYGASKAGLDHLTLILAQENPRWHIYAFDPGDMRTQMHQEAFPGQDISDRPLPEEIAVPGLLNLLDSNRASGRYFARQLLEPSVA